MPKSDSVQEILHSLNEQQQAAVTHLDGPALVMAGAGSGKTRVLTTRAAWLLTEQNVNPENILLVTFTNKAAQEMNYRVQNLVGVTLPWAGTFHRLSAKLLRADGHLIGIPPHFTIYDSDDQLSLVKQIYKDKGLDPKEFHPKAIKAEISKAKNELVNWEEYEQFAKGQFQEFTGIVYKMYERALRDQAAVDFDDLLLLSVKLLQTQKPVLGKYQDMLQHVMVDEYQDTNKAQYLLTSLLARPHNNVFVVGDFAQSIYAWRGADYRNMMLLKQEFNPMSEYKLEQNYRSTQTILDAATNVISLNTAHPVLELWTDNPKAEAITLIEAATGEGEAKEVATRIRKLQSSGYALKDIAILYRTNAQSRLFEEAFVRGGIPYTLVGGFKFYERKEIKDALAYLRLYLNPTDSVSRDRLSKLGKRKLAAFEVWSEHHRQAAATKPVGSQLTPHQLLSEILATTNFFDQFDEHDPEDVARIDNVNELLNVAAQFDDVAVLLENVALVQDDYMADAAGKENSDAVTMMSLHSAKGLEFPVVFMVGMEEGLLPHSRSLTEKAEMEEERRLCYVGITRAKEKLFLTHARQRWTYGTSSYAVRSRFIADIPSQLIQEETSTADSQYGNNGYGSNNGFRNSRSHNPYTGYPRNSRNQYNQNQYNDDDTSSSWASNIPSKTDKPKAKQPTAQAVTRRLILDDDQLDAFLRGEIDPKAYLEN